MRIYKYLIIVISLFLINTVNVKALKYCERTNDNLQVRENLINENNRNIILNTPCVDANLKVYDIADLLLDSEEQLLYGEALHYINKTNYDIVLVTINENNKKDAMNYADDFYDYNYFGKGNTRDGILILIDMDTRKLYISTTGYAIKMYDDYRIERILDAGYDELVNQKYYNTFSYMIEAAIDYHESGYPASNNDVIIDENGHPHMVKYIPYNVIFIFAAIITIIVSVILYAKTRLKIKANSTLSYLTTHDEIYKTDRFITSFISKTRRVDTTNNNGSGSSFGGSSSHTSSSGSSHGGGGRSF